MSLCYRLLSVIFILPLLTSCSEMEESVSHASVPLGENVGQVVSATSWKTTTTANEYLIAAQQIGLANLGMTVGELKQRYPEATYRLTSLPNLPNVVAVNQNSEDLFYFIASPETGEFPADDRVIMFLITNNPRYTTVEGVGASSLLQDALKAYGPVQLYFSPDAEYAQFQNQPTSSRSGMGFWLKPTAGERAAGIYKWIDSQKGICEAADSGFCESNQFNPEATVGYISIGTQR